MKYAELFCVGLDRAWGFWYTIELNELVWGRGRLRRLS